MITEVNGDILAEPWDTWIVILVNCVGVAGAGLAKQWAVRYPEANRTYIKICEEHQLEPGNTWWMMREEGQFILAATKDHWRQPSRMEWVESIVDQLHHSLYAAVGELEIAIPPIGCGLGGLPWSDVRDLLWDALTDCTDGRIARHTIRLYTPQ